MGISDQLKAESGTGPARRNRVDILLSVLTEVERIELEEVLFDLSWGHAAVTRAIPKSFDYPEAHQLKQTSVREWRTKRGLLK